MGKVAFIVTLLISQMQNQFDKKETENSALKNGLHVAWQYKLKIAEFTVRIGIRIGDQHDGRIFLSEPFRDIECDPVKAIVGEYDQNIIWFDVYQALGQLADVGRQKSDVAAKVL